MDRRSLHAEHDEGHPRMTKLSFAQHWLCDGGRLLCGKYAEDTSALVTTSREADLGTVRAQLDRAEVRAKFEDMGVDATAVERRIASLNDRELHQLAVDMQNAPAGGDAVWIIGAVFIVLIILELTGVIDIFKKT